MSTVFFGQIAETVAPDKLVSVTGSVTNSVTREGVQRAHVLLRPTNNPAQQSYGAITGADGKFAVTQLPPGEYVISAEKPGFQAEGGPTNQLKLDAGQKKETVKLVLIPGGAITGRVVDADGQPVESAMVSVPDGGGAMTDDQGRFRIGGLRPGRFKLIATLRILPATGPETRTDGSEQPNYAATYYPGVLEEKAAGHVAVRAGAETSGIEVRLVKTPVVRVAGTVIGIPEGQSGRDWYVQFSTKNNRFAGAQVRPDGTFAAWRVSPGRYLVIARASRGAIQLRTASVQVDVGGANVEGLELKVVAPFELKGLIQYDDDASRPKAASVSAAAPNRGRDTIALQEIAAPQFGRVLRADVNADGTFVIQQVQPGRYVGMPNWGAYVRSMQLGSRRMEGQTLDLSNGANGETLSIAVNAGLAELSGVVRRGEDAAAGESVALARVPADGSMLRSMVTGVEGTFTFRRLPPGSYKLVVVDKDEAVGGWFRKDADDLEGGEEIRVMPGTG